MKKNQTGLSAQNRIAQIASTLAIENLFLDKESIENLNKLANKEKSPEEVIDELNKEYGVDYG